MPTVTEIESKLADRKRLVRQAGALVDRAAAEGRPMTADENRQFNAMHDEAMRLYDAAQIPSTAADAGPLVYRGSAVAIPPGSAADRRRAPAYARNFSGHLGGAGPEFEAGLRTDIAEHGGYLAPPAYAVAVLQSIDDSCWVRRVATVHPPTTATSVDFARRSSRMTKLTWGQELKVPAADAGLKVGGYRLTPHYMVGELQVSADQLALNSTNVDAFVRGEIASVTADTEEDAFFNGDGILKPVGLFVPNPSVGLGTDRDKTVAITQDGLLDTKFTLKEKYLRSPSLRWGCHRNFVRAVAKLKSTANEPLWLVTLRANEPDLVLGVPAELSEYCPAGTGAGNTYAAGDYAAVLGDFRNYHILDSLDLAVQFDTSLERRRNTAVYIIRPKVDGCVRDPEAFVRLKVA